MTPLWPQLCRILYTNIHTSHHTSLCVFVQVQSEFILESERESFIEQVREVIENADERGLERDANSQVNTTLCINSVNVVVVFWGLVHSFSC